MTPSQIAEAFREARLNATALGTYPGVDVPADLQTAYSIQTTAISAWPGPVGGWKVAAIQPQWRDRYPAERLAGPVFAAHVWPAERRGTQQLPVIENGYAAIELEFILHIGKTLPLRGDWRDAQQLREYVGQVHAGIELAASPLAGLSALGPGAVISDFGNNSGIVVGPALPGFFDQPLEHWQTRVQINGQAAGEGSAAKVPGGPLQALLFLANHLADRGIALKEGDWVSSGATTGIHPVVIGDRYTAHFGADITLQGEIASALSLLAQAR
ncbi:hypothetical protein V8Z80_14525 [Orrella sp. JC864]|uniref:2-keto-4-pentenoate hydratase n=1 Tax=Orrella sp. JC864 TaxID=3120298 RepID=UPI00300B1A78